MMQIATLTYSKGYLEKTQHSVEPQGRDFVLPFWISDKRSKLSPWCYCLK